MRRCAENRGFIGQLEYVRIQICPDAPVKCRMVAIDRDQANTSPPVFVTRRSSRAAFSRCAVRIGPTDPSARPDTRLARAPSHIPQNLARCPVRVFPLEYGFRLLCMLIKKIDSPFTQSFTKILKIFYSQLYPRLIFDFGHNDGQLFSRKKSLVSHYSTIDQAIRNFGFPSYPHNPQFRCDCNENVIHVFKITLRLLSQHISDAYPHYAQGCG